MALGVSDISTIDVHTFSGFEGDIVDSVDAAVTEDRHVSFLVDSLADLLNLRQFGVGAIVCSTEKRLPFFAFVNSDHCPGQMVMYRSRLARVPDPADDGICFIIRHLEKIHGEPVLTWSERSRRDGPIRSY